MMKKLYFDLTKCAHLSRACHLPILTLPATVFIPLSATGPPIKVRFLEPV